MNITDQLLLCFGDSMDAFAVAVAYGITAQLIRTKSVYFAPLTFGLFQGAMVTIGFFFGSFFTGVAGTYANLIALILLVLLGGKMIFDSLKNAKKEDEPPNTKISFGVLMVQGFATSIDALAIGVSISLLSVNIVTFALLNAVITGIICIAGILIGKWAGKFLGSKAEIAGGIILIIIGLKIFIEGLMT
ncbi:MAG: manganese efflux pump [Ruminococcus sp.]|jgi:putative Mn2+ efflux pump MntP|nr:manganese efflux pump [Ruminococcus sp.]